VSGLGRVAVLMGGPSAEREISLMSGTAVLGALRERGVDAHAFDPAQRPLHELARERFDRAFIALHGRFGEDGTVQGALETLGIPYTGSGVLGSALSMDKWRTKLVWMASGIPTPAFRVLRADTDWRRVAVELGDRLVVKPAREGSTIGVSKVLAVEGGELEAAYAAAVQHDELVLVEELVEGVELTAAVLGERALPLVRIEAPQGNYDYQSKYFSEETRYYCPSGIDPALEARIRETVLDAFLVLGCRDWGRADLILRPDGGFSLLEMNTSPGMTGHSLVPMAAREAGLAFPELCLEILRMTLERHVG
jgi:D-alanine-D-alanine ligase